MRNKSSVTEQANDAKLQPVGSGHMGYIVGP